MCSASALEIVLLIPVAILGRRKPGKDGSGRVAVVKLGQNDLAVDRDVSVDHPHVCVHLEWVVVKPRLLVQNRIDPHIGALTLPVGHLAHLA
jgi:hypothetical protein